MSEHDDRQKAARIREDLSPWQEEMAEDPDDHQGIVAGRRRGKTFGFAAILTMDALENPGGQELYATDTKEHARALLWDNPDTGIKALDQRYDLRLKYDNTRAIARFSNQSLIALFGADREDTLDKQRGKGNRNVIVDECGSFSVKRLERFIEKIIEPTLADYGGLLRIGGTPCPRLAGPFFEATSRAFFGVPPDKLVHNCVRYKDRNKKEFRGKQFGWSMHQASGWKDNRALPHLRQYAYKLKARKKWPDDHKSWVMEWLGLWMLDLSALVYQYKTDYDWRGGGLKALPRLPEGAGWHTVAAWHWHEDGVVGVVVCAYNEATHDVYELDSQELVNPSLKQLAKLLRFYEETYQVEDIVGTRPGKSKGKGIIGELRDQMGLFCFTGDLGEMYDLIVVSNNDLAAGHIRVVQDGLLRQHLLALQWADPGVEIDDEIVSTSVTTAWLYCLRFCNHRGPRQGAIEAGPKPGTPEHLDKQALEAIRRLQKQESSASTDDWLEGELGEIDGDFPWREGPSRAEEA